MSDVLLKLMLSAKNCYLFLIELALSAIYFVICFWHFIVGKYKTKHQKWVIYHTALDTCKLLKIKMQMNYIYMLNINRYLSMKFCVHTNFCLLRLFKEMIKSSLKLNWIFLTEHKKVNIRQEQTNVQNDWRLISFDSA